MMMRRRMCEDGDWRGVEEEDRGGGGMIRMSDEE